MYTACDRGKVAAVDIESETVLSTDKIPPFKYKTTLPQAAAARAVTTSLWQQEGVTTPRMPRTSEARCASLCPVYCEQKCVSSKSQAWLCKENRARQKVKQGVEDI